MRFLKNVPWDFWWDVAKQCPYATFYHSPLWHALAERAGTDLTSMPIGAVCDDGTRLVLPVLKTGARARGLLNCYASTFAFCYGGLLADGPLSLNDRRTFYEIALAGRTDRIQITGNPLWSTHEVAGLETVLKGTGVETDFTQILELQGTYDDVVDGFSNSHQRNLESARKQGVTVREADSLDDYRAYYGAYEASLRRWGDDTSSRYSWKLFEKGQILAQEYPGHIRLWFAEVDSKVIAGAWVFYWNNHLTYWHGAAYEQYFDYRPNNLLHAIIIEHAMSNGYSYYDFNPSGGHEGVIEFKRRFGTVKYPVQRATLLGSKRIMIDRLKKLTAKQVFLGCVGFVP